jgi:hypothetical protein
MNNAYSKCSLFLCPKEHDYKHRDTASLTSLLRDIDLISGNLPASEQTLHYSVGEKFLDYIAYMGCSPAIQFDTTEDQDNFCHIKIHHHESPQLIYSKKQFSAPICPACKKPVKNWQQNISEAAIRCDHCQTVSDIETFNWRRMAGYAQLFIEITDIFPKEAVPQQILMDRLSSITDTGWLYFYSCQ